MKVKPRSEDATLTAEDLLSYKYVQEVFVKFAASKRLNPNVTWDDTSFQKKLQRLFKRMSKLERVAYQFTFGAPKFHIHHEMLPWSRELPPPSLSNGWANDGPNVIQDYLKYNVAEKYGVSFQNDEMTDTDVKNYYYEPFFKNEGEKILEYYKTRPLTTKDCHLYVNQMKKAMGSVEYGHKRNIIVSILHNRYIEEAVTRDLVKLLCERDLSVRPAKNYEDFLYIAFSSFFPYRDKKKALFHTYGKQLLEEMGVASKPFLVMGVGAQSKEDDILGITVLADVKPPEDDFRENFGKLKEFLDARDEQFMKMVSTQLIPQEDRVSEDFPQTGAETQGQEVMKKAVDLYATITNLTSAAVQAGVPRVLLMNSVDYLAIDLDKNLNLEPAIYKDGYFPKLVKCEYKWFNKEDHFIRAFLCSYIFPTVSYKDIVKNFKEHVSEALSQSIENLLQSITEALRLPGPDTQFERNTGWLRDKRAKFSSSPDTGTPLFSVNGAKLIYPGSFRDQKNSNPEGEFVLHRDILNYPFYAKMSEAVLSTIKVRRGRKSQILLVNPGTFLRYIPKCLIFNNAAGVDKAILKIYDPLWRNRSRFVDAERAFDDYGTSSYNHWWNEIETYDRLVPLMGSVIPNVYAYGYVVDVSLKVGQLYRRYTGPFILMEWLDREPIHRSDFLDRCYAGDARLVSELTKIHELGVIHADIQWRHFMVTKDDKLKIFDFSESWFSNREDRQISERDNIREYLRNSR